jgi:hypothetical protein
MFKNSMRHDFETLLLRLQQDHQKLHLSDAEFCASLMLFFDIKLQNKKLFPHISTPSVIIQSLNHHHWIGHTDRIRRALIQWHLGNYPLQLLNTVPSPVEILRCQALGKRVVTVFTELSQWDQMWGPHNAWNFIAHDLIHADHFFENSVHQKGQMEFYQFVLKNWAHPEIHPLHSSPGFEYLISDMNSHPQHLFETLKNLVIQNHKKNLALDFKQRLPLQQEVKIQKLFSFWDEEINNRHELAKPSTGKGSASRPGQRIDIHSSYD